MATGAPAVLVAVKSRGGEVGRLAQLLGLHWRDSVLAIDPEQLADFPTTQAEKARREARRVEEAVGPSSEPVKRKRNMKSDRVSFYRHRDTNKSERKKPSNDSRSKQVKEFVKKQRLARDIAKIGNPFDDVSLEKKKQFGLHFYYKKLQVCRWVQYILLTEGLILFNKTVLKFCSI